MSGVAGKSGRRGSGGAAVSVYLSESGLVEKLDRMAAATCRSRSQVITLLLKRYLDAALENPAVLLESGA